MLDIDQSEILDGEVTDEAEPAGDAAATSTALVPLAATTHWAPKVPLPHADPSFVAHLIATAAHEPQTRGLRRGSLADVQSAYGPHVDERRSVARRTRQII
ncbi:hypothetical protein ABIB82_005970 [Bradyrhizobium sp. i1.8.4]|uniref:hypothetical protein n=1 Tax=unclassified Bradyrhizobium TaxID=2631580 RepID=UPI003D22B0A7